MTKHYIPEAGIVVDDSDNSLPYFLLGLGLGAVAGILLAPQSGEETRRMLKEKADEGVDYVKRRSSELQETATSALDRSKQTLQRQKESISAAVDAGRQAYREAASSDND
jgi:gas vesicle protein